MEVEQAIDAYVTITQHQHIPSHTDNTFTHIDPHIFLLFLYSCREKEETLLQKIYIKYSEVDLYFLVIQVVLQLAHFIYVIVTTLHYTPPPSIPSPTSWQRYQMLYASYFNSGVATVGHAILRKTEQDVAKQRRKWALIVSIPLFLSVLPFLCTHSIPMIFAYAWVSLPLFLIGLLAATIMRKLQQRKISWFTLIVLMVLELVYFAAFIGLFQAPVNYGVLLYEHANSYVQVVPHEYDLRSSKCYFDEFDQELKTRNVLNLLSFLV